MGDHTIRANRMAPKNSMELSDSLRIKNGSIEVNLEMFFLFVGVKSELWVNVLPTCTGIVAVIKPPLTWEKFDLPEWQILSCYRAKLKLSTNDEWQLSIHTFCWRSRYTQVSFSAKKKSKLYFGWAKLCLHIHKLTLRTLILNKEGVKKERENIAGSQEYRSRGGGIVFIKVATFVRFCWRS